MSRAPIYATTASLNLQPQEEEKENSISTPVIRPPIRQAYESQEAYEAAKKQGILFAQDNNITYINHY